MSPIESPATVRRRSSGGVSRRAQLAVTPLSTIPGVYFDESFHLENPRTFDVVTERSEVIRNPQSKSEEAKAANGSTNGTAVAPRKALATNAILQEKLSWYLDTVEIHLISSISAASKSFFAALGSLKELHSEAADSVDKIRILREDLAQLDKDMAIGRLEIVRMKQRRDNLRKLSDATQQLQNVMKGAAHCEDLVERGELETALDRIGVLEDYTCGHYDPGNVEQHSWLCSEAPGHLLDLRQLKALEGFGNGMNQLRGRIGAGFQSRFMELLLRDLRQHVASVPNTGTLQRWASVSQRARGIQVNTSSGAPAYLQTSAELRESLSASLVGLKRSRYTIAATAAFRDTINGEMKSLIRHNLPSSSDDDNESVASISTRSSRAPLSQQEKSGILARNIRALGPEDAEVLLTKTYCAVGEALRRLQVQCKVLLDVSSDQSMSPTAKFPAQRQPMATLDTALHQSVPARSQSPNLQEELSQALDLSSLLGQAVDVAQSQIIKVLKVRSEQSTHLPLQRFLRYFTLNRLFADECEAVSGRSGAALKGVINNQISEFIGIMTETERQRLAQVMEGDQWDVKDFDEKDAAILSKILSGMTSDPPAYLQQAYIWEDPQSNGTSLSQSTTNGTSTKEKTRNAVIDEEKFLLTESAGVLLQGVSGFQALIACIPNISPEVSSALLDYLKLFNSLSCQLILGAGATRSSASLKNINTKHLALASQALSFVISLMPYMREFVRRRPGMNGGLATADYEKVKRLYHDHQVSIHEKLAEIMSTRAAAYVKTMNNINWDTDTGREGASPHMETLTKETNTLHRVLVKNLAEAAVKSIMVPVFASYREQWGKAFREAGPRTELGKARYAWPHMLLIVCAR
jgi:vacuolar protein sorting-associated protein 54